MVEEQRTGKALVEHWKWAADRGLMPKNSAQTMAVSCRRVLEVEQDWENVDVLALDEDELSSKFKTLRASSYKKSSLGDYASRFRNGVRSYRSFLADPDNWRYGSRDKKASTSKPQSRQSHGGDAAPNADQRTAGLQEYVYPFRKAVLATLTIPRDATSAEIRRLVAWAQTLAVDYEGH